MWHKQDRIWKKLTVSQFEVLSVCYDGGDAGNINTLWQNSLFEGRYMTPGPPKYEARVLIIQQKHWTHLLLNGAFEHNKHDTEFAFEDSGLSLLEYCHLKRVCIDGDAIWIQ
jgi:hypothetical protein